MNNATLFYAIICTNLCTWGCMSNNENNRTEITCQKIITIEELNTTQLVGQLGVPMGTIVEVDCQFSHLHQPCAKIDEGIFLWVYAINGKALVSPKAFRFEPLFPSDIWTGIQKSDRRIKLVCYESGQFYGCPVNIFDYAGIFSTPITGFAFDTFLILVQTVPSSLPKIEIDVQEQSGLNINNKTDGL